MPLTEVQRRYCLPIIITDCRFQCKIVLSALKRAFKSGFFTLDQNVGICLKCILTKFEVSTSSRYQDIALQN